MKSVQIYVHLLKMVVVGQKKIINNQLFSKTNALLLVYWKNFCLNFINLFSQKFVLASY